MQGYDIDRILRRDVFAKKYFRGVYPVDKLPIHENFERPACFVINTDPASRPGEHWVSLYLDEAGKGEFFDSFGLEVLHPLIARFLRRHCWYYTHNKRMLQSLTATTCGQYCVYFVKMRCRGHSLWRLLRPFHPTQPWRNDRFIMAWFRAQK